MARDKKKSIGIKTARYFTKTCSSCKYEYPNWFTNCPKCNTAWDEEDARVDIIQGEILKKTIKIVVKITEEDFDEKIEDVKLIFSADKGNNWFQISMENKNEYFIAEIADVPIGSMVIYYIEVILQNEEIVVENNEGQFYHYKVGTTIEQEKADGKKKEIKPKNSVKKAFPSDSEIYNLESNEYDQNTILEKKDHLKPEVKKPVKFVSFENTYNNTKIPKSYDPENNRTIFGRPQTQIDPDLKICPYCNSKIKKEWSTCPICGKDI